MEEREALVAKEAKAVAALRSIDRLVPAALIAMVGGGLAIAIANAAVAPIALLGITFGIVTLALKKTRQTHLVVVRRKLAALDAPPVARLIRD